jgi:hypothetical protein
VQIHGLVFVVDASDEARLEEVREELQNALRHPCMAQKSVLVFANKQVSIDRSPRFGSGSISHLDASRGFL